MDPVRIPETPDPLPRGSSVFIPFECFNIQTNGQHDKKLALDLPPKRTMHEARIYIANERLIGRSITFLEFSDSEIKKSIELMNYFGLWKGKY